MSTHREHRKPRDHLRSLYLHGLEDPFPAILGVVSIPIGILAVVIGNDVSRSFSIVYHRNEIIYLWGFLLLVGGYFVSAGIARTVPSQTRAGLAVLTVAYLFYALSVLRGLGVAGSVAGPLGIVAAAASFATARNITRSARMFRPKPPPDPGKGPA